MVGKYIRQIYEMIEACEIDAMTKTCLERYSSEIAPNDIRTLIMDYIADFVDEQIIEYNLRGEKNDQNSL